MRMIVVMSFLTSILASTVAASESDEEAFVPSKYGAVAFVLGIDQFEDGGVLDVSEGFGFDIVMGYRGHRYFSAEGEFVYLDGLDIRDLDIDIRYEIFTANLKFHPFEGQFEPYVLGGIGGGRIKFGGSGGGGVAESGAVFRLGAGIETNVSETFGVVLGANYLFTKGAISGSDTLELKLGVVSRFW